MVDSIMVKQNTQQLTRGEETITQVRVYQTVCTTQGLRELRCMHCYALLKLSGGSWCRIQRSKNQFQFEITENARGFHGIEIFTDMVHPGITMVLSVLRDNINQIFSSYNIFANNCFDFIVQVLKILQCGAQPVKYVEMAKEGTVNDAIDKIKGMVLTVVPYFSQLWKQPILIWQCKKKMELIPLYLKRLNTLLNKIPVTKGVFGMMNVDDAIVASSVAKELNKSINLRMNSVFWVSVVGQFINESRALLNDYFKGVQIDLARIGKYFGRIGGGILGAVQGIAVGTQIGAIIGTIIGVDPLIGGQIGGIIGSIAGSLKVKQILGIVGEGIGKIASAVWTATKEVSSAFWTATKAASSAVWTATKKVSSAFWTAVSPAVWTATEAVSSAVWTATKEVSSAAWTATKEVSSAVWTAAKQVSPAAWTATKKVPSAAWTATKEVSPAAWTATKKVSSAAWTATKEVSSAVCTATKEVLYASWTPVKYIFSWFW